MDDTNWHLDKKVPIALIFAIFLQTITVVWWSASINSRVSILEAKIAHTDEVIEDFIGLRAKVDSVDARTSRIEDKLDRVIEGKQ